MKQKNCSELLGQKLSGYEIVGFSCSIKRKKHHYLDVHLKGKCSHEFTRVFSQIRIGKKIICKECVESKRVKRTKFLTPIRFDKKVKNTIYWLYRCKCGNEKSIELRKIREKEIVSCGCYRSKINRKRSDKYVGTRINNFFVLNRKKVNKGVSKFKCKCDCGKIFFLSGKQICQGIKSCGCMTKKKLTESDAREIRKFKSIGYSGRELSKIYDVSAAAVHDILNNRSWKPKVKLDSTIPE